MKIALISDWFVPRRGGIEGQLNQLAQRLGEIGHDVDVITSTPGAVGGSAFNIRQLHVSLLPRAGISMSPWLARHIRRALGRGYDVAHAHVSVISPVGYVGAVVARSLGLPTVVTFHSVLRHKRHLLRLGNALANIATSAVEWTAVSQLVASQVRAAFSGAEIAVLPNGIDLAFWRSPEKQASTRSGLTLVSAMRLHRKKRPLELVRAFARAAHRAGVEARLVVAGDGPERARLLKEIRALGLEGGRVAIELTGWLTMSELRDLYRAADGFVLPSTREAFGVAALEARASGLPVIAMRVSGSSEFLQHETTALLCENDADLAHQMGRFLSEPALRRRLAAEPATLGDYGWPRVIEAHERSYASARLRAAPELVEASM